MTAKNNGKTTKPSKAEGINSLFAKAMATRVKYKKCWLDMLSESQRNEIIEAAKQWQDTGRPWTVLAQVIREQMGLDNTLRSIADGLKKVAQS